MRTISLNVKLGGEGGIRTLETLRSTAFRVRRTRPTMRPLRDDYFAEYLDTAI